MCALVLNKIKKTKKGNRGSPMSPIEIPSQQPSTQFYHITLHSTKSSQLYLPHHMMRIPAVIDGKHQKLSDSAKKCALKV